MKNFHLLLTLAFCLLLSCEPNPDIIINDRQDTKKTVLADQTEIKGGISFSTEGNWHYDIYEYVSNYDGGKDQRTPDWIRIESNGNHTAGDHTIKVILYPNYTEVERVAEIVITCKKSVLKITITQKNTTANGEILLPPMQVESIEVGGRFDGVEYNPYTCFNFIYDRKYRVEALDDRLHNLAGISYGFMYSDMGEYADWPGREKVETEIQIAVMEGAYSSYYLLTLDPEKKKRVTKIDYYNTNTTNLEEVAAFTYNNDGYLTECEKADGSSFIYAWQNGNLSSVTSRSPGKDDIITLYSSYNNMPNAATPIDVNMLFTDMKTLLGNKNNKADGINLSTLAMIDLLGNRSKNHITKPVVFLESVIRWDWFPEITRVHKNELVEYHGVDEKGTVIGFTSQRDTEIYETIAESEDPLFTEDRDRLIYELRYR